MTRNILECKLAGITFKSPVILASGILGTNGDIMLRVAKHGAGGAVLKSVSLTPKEGYINPTIVKLNESVINAMGLPNPGIDNFTTEIKKAKKSGIPIIVSIFGNSENEFAEVAIKAEMAGADIIELNVSCPQAKVGLIGQNAEATRRVTEAVKNAVKVPVFVKLTPNVTDIAEIASACEDAGADGITAINTVKAMAIDIDVFKPILSNKFGGLSGRSIKPIAVRCVYEIYEKVDIPIIGVGGIFDWRDAVEMMLAGASAVQIGTALIKGVEIFNEINLGIKRYLSDKGFGSLSEIIGLAHRS
ncbi:MAG: dihydroorotate dehydrogenase [Candidatus Odinarchaeia archaeon]